MSYLQLLFSVVSLAYTDSEGGDGMLAGKRMDPVSDKNRHLNDAKTALAAWKKEYSFAENKISKGYQYYQEHLVLCEKMIALWKTLIKQIEI